MTLVLEIEYLSGVCFAAKGPDSEAPDWPPQPDRVFSALVAAWAARGHDNQEQAALEWLEKQPPPHVVASQGEPRTAPVAYVPPNDPSSLRKKTATGVLPALRSRQPRRFPAIRPNRAVVHMLWDVDAPEADIGVALQRLAADVAYVGHSASLTRCRFSFECSALHASEARFAKRWVYAGRFAELRHAFDAGRRPQAGQRVTPPIPDNRPANVFCGRWLLFEHVAGEMPDLRSSSLVAKTLRDSLLAGYRRIGLEAEIPEVVSGHSAAGEPTRAPHLAIVPLPFAGFPYADGHVMGFALVPPVDSGILQDGDFRRVLRKLAPVDENLGRRLLGLSTRNGTPKDRAFSVGLSPTFEAPPGRRTLDPALYNRPARVFATVTPIVVDRHLKAKGAARQVEIAAQIAAACLNIGLPEPELIVSDKHSPMEGVPSAYPSSKSPHWMRWRVPSTLSSRQLTHAIIRFAEPVVGPVLLGAGRFIGMGLCRPLGWEE